MDTRTETDFLGAVEVPAEAYWGSSTQRALANFGLSGSRVDAGSSAHSPS